MKRRFNVASLFLAHSCLKTLRSGRIEFYVACVIMRRVGVKTKLLLVWTYVKFLAHLKHSVRSCLFANIVFGSNPSSYENARVTREDLPPLTGMNIVDPDLVAMAFTGRKRSGSFRGIAASLCEFERILFGRCRQPDD